MTDRTIPLARSLEREVTQRRIMMDSVGAVMEDRVLDAASHIAALDRPYVEALTTKAITILELAKERSEELDLRDQAGGTYHQPRREYPGMDEPA